MTTVYLAGPINGCSDEQANMWRGRARAWLEQYGVDVLDPMRRDYRGVDLDSDNPRLIVESDLADIQACDAVLVNCDRSSWGTAMEVRAAYTEFHKPVVGFMVDPRTASPWLQQHTNAIECTVERAVSSLWMIFLARITLKAHS